MQCDLCNKPAVVHEVTVKNGVKKEVHLCEEHAAESGITMPVQQPVHQLLTQFVISQSGKGPEPAAAGRASRKTCPGCGMAFSQFRQTGIVGCAECYESFEAQLAPLIQRAQNGATHHTGRAPRRSGQSIDRQLERRRLLKELDEAVGAEQYERAAKIRDVLNTMDAPEHSDSETGDASGNVRGPA